MIKKLLHISQVQDIIVANKLATIWEMRYEG